MIVADRYVGTYEKSHNKAEQNSSTSSNVGNVSREKER